MTYRLAGERYEGVFAEGLETDVARRWLDEAHGWFDAPAGLPGPSDVRGARGTARLALVESPLGLAVAKEIAPGRLAFRRRRRAARVFTDALHLAAVGVATAQPFAALLPRRGGDPAVFVAERIDAPTLAAWAAGPRGAAAPGELGVALAGALLRMHRSGLRHRDLKAPNVLVELDGRDVLGVVLIDLDGVRRRRLGIAPRAWRDRARDLARLRLSLLVLELDGAVWKPLCARYAAGAGDSPAGLDAWTRRWAERHRARNERRGRPTA